MKTRRLRRVGALALLGAMAAFGTQAAQAADAWHCSTLRIIVPYAPGGGTDTIARMVSAKLAEQEHLTAIVDNRPGGKGVIAYQAMLHERADGCTLVLDNSSHTIQASYKSLPYDPTTAFQPVSLVALWPTLLAVAPGIPSKNLSAFLAYAKDHRITYGSYGVGSQSHLDGEALGAATGLPLVHIPYRGSAPALNDLLAGHIQALFADGLASRSLISSGKITAIAAVGSRRWKSFPDLPTFGELGYADLSSPGWGGIFAPAGTPRPIVNEIAAALQRVAAQPDTQAKMAEIGAEAFTNSPDQFAAQVRNESAHWKSIIAARRIEIE